MPKCVKCNEFFPPNYTEIVEGSTINGLTGEYPQHCIFCKLGVNTVERETERNSGKFITYTKQECIRDYKQFISKIRNTSDILNRKDSRIVVP